MLGQSKSLGLLTVSTSYFVGSWASAGDKHYVPRSNATSLMNKTIKLSSHVDIQVPFDLCTLVSADSAIKMAGEYERISLVKPEAFVYQIPPRASNRSVR